MAISDKLNYLIETKQLFKDRLNSLGAEIIGSTTFRNYLNWLDNFYIGSANKTDLAKNGVVGRTNQDEEPTPENPVEINNLSGDVEYKVRGKNLFDKDNKIVSGKFYTSTGEIGTDSGLFLQESYIKVKPNSEYTFSSKNNDYFRMCEYDINKTFIQRQIVSNNTANSITYTTTSTTEYIRVSCNNANLATLQIEKGSTPTEYESHISESFPLSLKSKNLFDKDNINVISAYISGSRVIASAAVDKLIYIPCKPNTTYSLQKMLQETTNYNRFRIGTTTDIPALRMTVEDYFNAGDGSTLTNKTITTGANANYLVFYCYREDTLTSFEDMMSSIQIEEGSTATTYEPYYDINLCNISDYKDRIYSQNGEFYLEKKIEKHLFTTNDIVGKGSSSSDGYARCGWGLYSKIAVADLGKTLVICNKFLGVSQNNNSPSLTGEHWYCSLSNADGFKIMFRCGSTEYTSDTFPEFIKNNGIIVYYPLRNHTTTKITQENYPTLYSQLLAIQEFLTKYKINKEFLLDYSSPEIEY